MQSSLFWRNKIYLDMCHVYSSARGFIAGITTLDAEDELAVLVIMHFQSEDEHNYTILLEVFIRNYLELYAFDVVSVSGDGNKRIAVAVKCCLPNEIQMLCLFHIIKNISSKSMILLGCNWEELLTSQI